MRDIDGQYVGAGDKLIQFCFQPFRRLFLNITGLFSIPVQCGAARQLHRKHNAVGAGKFGILRMQGFKQKIRQLPESRQFCRQLIQRKSQDNELGFF